MVNDLQKEELKLEDELFEICLPIEYGDFESFKEYAEAVRKAVLSKNPKIDDYLCVESYAKNWWDDFWYDYNLGSQDFDESNLNEGE